MNDFTASNGITVVEQPGGGFYIGDTCRAENVYAQALREFFRAEEDARLGRWRWPENPDYVVYPMIEGLHRVIQESTGESRPRNGLVGHDLWGDAACAYHETHPEPWEQDPRIGDIWEFVLVSGGKPIVAVLRAVNGGEWRWAATDNIADLSNVQSARRIYPEPTV